MEAYDRREEAEKARKERKLQVEQARQAKRTVERIILEQDRRYRSEKQDADEFLRPFRRMPSQAKMRLSLSQLHRDKKQQILRDVSQGEHKMEAMLKLKDRSFMEGGGVAYGSEVREYVRNFESEKSEAMLQQNPSSCLDNYGQIGRKVYGQKKILSFANILKQQAE